MTDFDKIMLPVWDTDIIYGESLLFVREDGKISAPLMFMPEEIISVTTADLSETFTEGRDYVINGREISLTPSSRIFYFEYDELYPKQSIPQRSFRGENSWLLFGEGHFFHDRQVAVTYKCKKGGWGGAVPEYCGDMLPKTTEKLQNGGEINLVLFGDSISEGANASKVVGAPPYQPCWGELLAMNLSRKTGAKVNFHNPSLGGTNSVWAVQNTQERVNSLNPDLVVIAFGANDINREPAEFTENIKTVIKTVSASFPDAEFIVVATSVPNKKAVDFNGRQKEHIDYLKGLSASGVVVADITGMQRTLYSHKRFIDVTGNNINHPNDFFHRLYAQFVSGMLIK